MIYMDSTIGFRTRCKRDYTLNVDDKFASLLMQNILAMTNGKIGEHVY